MSVEGNHHSELNPVFTRWRSYPASRLGCRIDTHETDRLISIMRESGLSREEFLETWEVVAPPPANNECDVRRR